MLPQGAARTSDGDIDLLAPKEELQRKSTAAARLGGQH
jgi:hypothetical protein